MTLGKLCETAQMGVAGGKEEEVKRKYRSGPSARTATCKRRTSNLRPVHPVGTCTTHAR